MPADQSATTAIGPESLIVVACMLATWAGFVVAPKMFTGGDRPFRYGRVAPTVLDLANGEALPTITRVASTLARPRLPRLAVGATMGMAVIVAFVARARGRLWVYGLVMCVDSMVLLLQVLAVVLLLL